LDREIAEVRARVDELRAMGAPTRTRYSREFRQRVVELVREQQRQGFSLRGVARAVGLREATLQRWVRDGSAAESGLRRVVVEPLPIGSAGPDLVVFAGPLRIEGLDVGRLSELVRRLA